ESAVEIGFKPTEANMIKLIMRPVMAGEMRVCSQVMSKMLLYPLAAPIHPATVIAGKMLAFIGIVFLQMLVLFGICFVFFDMPLGDSPLALLTLTLALALAATGLGMLVGSLAQTSKQAGSIGMLLGFVLFIAAGLTPATAGIGITDGVVELILPSEGFSFYLSQITPHAHAFDGYLKLIIHGAGFGDIIPNILALLGFAAVFFVVAIWRFKFD
ncbi:MAG TPA: ABC transporter permease, partial [Anaerolineales bacterium]|nr:ABC transporter permease [Anaerolineales bacterium]